MNNETQVELNFFVFPFQLIELLPKGVTSAITVSISKL